MDTVAIRTEAKNVARKLGLKTGKAARLLEEAFRRLLMRHQGNSDGGSSARPTEVETASVASADEEPGKPTGCYVRIPFSGDSEKYVPLRRAIASAATELNLSQFTTAQVMSVFFSEIADALCRGEPVRIPAFGMLIATLFERPGLRPKPYVGFCAARPLALQVKYSCPIETARDGKELLRRHRKQHHPSNRRERIQSRVFTAMAAFRRQIERQAEGQTGKRGA